MQACILIWECMNAAGWWRRRVDRAEKEKTYTLSLSNAHMWMGRDQGSISPTFYVHVLFQPTSCSPYHSSYRNYGNGHGVVCFTPSVKSIVPKSTNTKVTFKSFTFIKSAHIMMVKLTPGIEREIIAEERDEMLERDEILRLDYYDYSNRIIQSFYPRDVS